jgi:predicted NodU family carbamoyl transferase
VSITLGLSLSRNGSMALLDGNKLIFFSRMASAGKVASQDEAVTEQVPSVLVDFGYAMDDVGQWVVAGSTGTDSGVEWSQSADGNGLIPPQTGCMNIAGVERPYASYSPSLSRLAVAYCTSPFAKREEPAIVLVSDEKDSVLMYSVTRDGRLFAKSDEAGNIHEHLRRLATRWPEMDGHQQDFRNLCLAGEAVANPRGNSALRDASTADELWIPPLLNDVGILVGAAAIRAGEGRLTSLQWDLNVGPDLRWTPHVPNEWAPSPCRPEELGRLLYAAEEPIVFLKGRAGIDETSLGSRCILMPPTAPGAVEKLDAVRCPDGTRSITILCLEEHAGTVFDPGHSDPYALFDHEPRTEWLKRMPTALGEHAALQLQTVSRADFPDLTAALREYYQWSGIPFLCAVRAQGQHGDVFSDAGSVMRWGKVTTIWSDWILYRQRP